MMLLAGLDHCCLAILKLILVTPIHLRSSLKVLKKLFPALSELNEWIIFIVIMIAEKGDKIAGFLFEPIQGEAGVKFLFSRND